jgi:hypothetical protein
LILSAKVRSLLEKQQILKEIEKTMPRPFEALSDEEYNKRMQRVKELQSLVAASPEQRLRSELEGGPMAPALPSTAQTATATAAVPTQAPSGIAALQSDTGGVPTQTLAGIEEAQAAQKAQKERAATSDPFAMLNIRPRRLFLLLWGRTLSRLGTKSLKSL